MKKIAVIGGGGRVGLPLSILFAKAGNFVKIIDTDKSRVALINKREMPFYENGASEILKSLSEEHLFATDDVQAIDGCRICVLIIGTPVGEDGVPSASFLVEFVQELIPHLRTTKLLILRSTVFPGITEAVSKLLKSQLPQIQVAFCPERIAQGNAIDEIERLPQIVGVESELAFEECCDLFRGITGEILRCGFKEAEISKLFANVYRYIKFAVANEFFEMCVSNGIDWTKVWETLTHNYPRAKDLPKPGFAAGPCLVKDTQQLVYFDSKFSSLGLSAMKINETLPDYIVSFMNQNFDLSNLTIGILGMTFKGDVDDFRSSLSFKLRNLLSIKCKKVICSDSVLNDQSFYSMEHTLETADVIIIASPHSSYRGINVSKPLIDIWRISTSKSLL